MKTKIQLNGRHWETGSIHNALALQGVKAPHTGQPYSEASLQETVEYVRGLPDNLFAPAL
jgi:hypothetical protein